MKSVTLPSSDVVSYEADLYGRRAYRKFNGTITSRYFYDGGRLRAELDSARQLKAVFVYASKSHVPDYMIAGGDKYRIVTDHLGSVRLVVKVSDGTVAQEIEYNELGKVLSDTNPGFQPFGFAGGLYDAATGLVRFGARDYDPETGRWTSKDPILFGGGDANLYGYVMADPINLIDPTGLVKCSYSASSGRLVCTSNDGKRSVDFGPGGAFSGHGSGTNNPAMDDVPNIGPIPAGNYSIHPTGSPNTFNLSPDLGTRISNFFNGNRNGFQMHPGSRSNGCITLPTEGNNSSRWNQLRNMIRNDGSNNSITIGR